jgi:uncharacterized repeat protein (TIGR03803 family)
MAAKTKFATALCSLLPTGGKSMKLVSRGIAIALAALILTGWTSPTPVESVLYRFQGGQDGFNPQSGLIADKEGALYGTTPSGGSGNCAGFAGCGTVFQLTPARDKTTGKTTWTEKVLYSFQGGQNGFSPQSGLIADKEGALYGTTSYGGNCTACGTVFQLTPARDKTTGKTTWTEKVLYSFQARDTFFGSHAGLIADSEGALYGTTELGGSGSGGICATLQEGCGTVFQLTPARDKTTGKTTWTAKVLYSFQGGNDGGVPLAGLIADSEGALYGTTEFGGSSKDAGTVFQLTPARDKTTGKTTWTEKVLYSFQGGSDGLFPKAGLIADRQGALYSTTSSGGSGGTVFQLTPARNKTTGKTTWTREGAL